MRKQSGALMTITEALHLKEILLSQKRDYAFFMTVMVSSFDLKQLGVGNSARHA